MKAALLREGPRSSRRAGLDETVRNELVEKRKVFWKGDQVDVDHTGSNGQKRIKAATVENVNDDGTYDVRLLNEQLLVKGLTKKVRGNKRRTQTSFQTHIPKKLSNKQIQLIAHRKLNWQRTIWI